MASSRAFQALAVSTSVVAYGLVILGATVRVTGSGMGCPDWPLCFGHWLPPFALAPILEWVHRLVAGLVSTGVVALLGWIALSRAWRQKLGGWAIALAVCLLSQVLLGAYTVAVSNAPLSVALHLIMGYWLLGTLIAISRKSLQTSRPPGGVNGDARWLSWGCLFAVMAQAFIGALVAASHAGRICPDFPTCNGLWLPALTGQIGLQMLHRYGAAIVTVLVASLVAVFEARRLGRLRGYTRLAGLLLAGQLALGISAVVLPVSLAINIFHQVGAVSLYSTLCLLALAVSPAAQPAMSASPRAAAGDPQMPAPHG